MNIQPYAFDSETMENITEEAVFKINYKNKWVDFAEIPQEELHSATVWKIKES